ncbi:hypothetical protein BJX61DRAFT_541094 [Aspergillus egyptiacus]|nr:hypothetical protein BJX61DRAFT_541094 [Aspergillus egyptiacus]
MLKVSQAYLLGGAPLLSTIVVTVLDGVCYGISRVSDRDSSSIEGVIVSLSSFSCAMVLALILACASGPTMDTSTRRKLLKASTCGTGIVYFLLAAGITAGGIAWSTIQSREVLASPHRQSLFIARCAIWATSILSQGVLCGYLLTTFTDKDTKRQWPASISHDPETLLPSRPVTIQKGAASSICESQRQFIDTNHENPQRASSPTSQRSDRYSGKTIMQPLLSADSFDSSPTLISYPESVATCNSPYEVADSKNSRNKLQRPELTNSRIERSLDNVLIRQFSISSSTRSDASKSATPRLTLPYENNIHPLFRADSPSPPTPTPGTMVLGAPEAGQTISIETLRRMRSMRSVSTLTTRSKSPLLERTDGCEAEAGFGFKMQ